jgi:hypothetical protein
MNGRCSLLGRQRTLSVSSRVRWWLLLDSPSRNFSSGREMGPVIEDESFVIGSRRFFSPWPVFAPQQHGGYRDDRNPSQGKTDRGKSIDFTGSYLFVMGMALIQPRPKNNPHIFRQLKKCLRQRGF